MVICRTPLRISFFGGGTDYPLWYYENSGCVIATSIDKYNFISLRNLPPYFKFKYRLKYHKVEEAENINQIKHPSVRACLKFFQIKRGMELTYNADLPAQSGLGSSSSFTVGLINAIYALNNFVPNNKKLAQEAIHIEQKILNENIGSQDQITASFGGFNIIDFLGKKNFNVTPINISDSRKKNLQDNLLLFFTGFQRKAETIAKQIIKNINKNKNELKEISFITKEAFNILNSNNSPDEFGKLLNDQWKVKKKLARLVTNNIIDDIYEAGLSNGALGGKLLGAGAGGFILFYVKKNNQKKLIKALKKLVHVPFKFEDTGSSIIYTNND